MMNIFRRRKHSSGSSGSPTDAESGYANSTARRQSLPAGGARRRQPVNAAPHDYNDEMSAILSVAIEKSYQQQYNRGYRRRHSDCSDHQGDVRAVAAAKASAVRKKSLHAPPTWQQQQQQQRPVSPSNNHLAPPPAPRVRRYSTDYSGAIDKLREKESEGDGLEPGAGFGEKNAYIMKLLKVSSSHKTRLRWLKRLGRV